MVSIKNKKRIMSAMAVCNFIPYQVLYFLNVPNHLSQQNLRVDLYFSAQIPQNQGRSLPLHFLSTSSVTSKV